MLDLLLLRLTGLLVVTVELLEGDTDREFDAVESVYVDVNDISA